MIKKALLIANNGPETTFGGGQRNLLAIKLLEGKGYSVDMILLINRSWGIYGSDAPIIRKWKNDFGMVDYFQPDFKNPYLPDFSVVKKIKKIQDDYEVLLFRDDVTAFKSGFYFLHKSKIIIDLNDFVFPRVVGYRKIKYVPLFFIIKNWATNFWVLLEDHKKLFSKNVFWVPNLPLVAFHPSKRTFIKRRTLQPSILFVGSYLAEFISFLDEALRMLQSIPHLSIFVISRAITADIKAKYTSDIFHWLDKVEDISEYYERAWLSIVPGYKKEGTLIKLIESIYFDTPVVSTKAGLAGYEVFNLNEQLIPADDNVFNFVENIKQLLLENDLLDSRARKLKKIAHEKYSVEAILRNDIFT